MRRSHDAAGFSLVELMIVVAMIGILGGMAVLQIDTLRKGLLGDGAMRVVMGQLNIARETAVARRRSVTVEFVGSNVLRLTIGDEASNVAFESGVQYALVQDMGDTPDGFGRAAPTTFGSTMQTTVTFNSEGSLVDGGGSPINGTVFLAVPGEPLTARAVTVLGTIGRVRGYRWDGTRWSRV
jgi:prepilin-type N-terminal cleavage/methylation domain-containing protein